MSASALFRFRPILAAVAVAAAVAPQAWAQPASGYSALARWNEDEKAVAAAREAALAGGVTALTPYIPQLRAVLDRAPASYPQVSTFGPVVTVRADNEEDAARLFEAAAPNAPRGAMSFQFNTYGVAAFMQAAWFNNQNRPEEALAVADRGLALQPRNVNLVMEKGVALTLLERPAEALAVLDDWLASAAPASKSERGMLLQNRGSALTELNRLDEAEQAYREALRLDPGHPNALEQLDYIASLRAGGPRKGVTVIPAGEIKREDPAAPRP